MIYLVGNVILFIPWLFFFHHRKKFRKEMILMGLLASPLCLLDLFFAPSYWLPNTLFDLPIGIEGFLFTFIIGGLSAVIYAEVFHQIPIKFNEAHRIFFSVIATIVPLIIFLSLIRHVPNIMISAFIGLIIGTSLIIFFRRDLAKSALLGSLIFGSIYFVCFVFFVNLFPQFKEWFTLNDLPKIYILNVPIYEIIFAYLFGAYWGNIFELFFGYRFRKSK